MRKPYCVVRKIPQGYGQEEARMDERLWTCDGRLHFAAGVLVR